MFHLGGVCLLDVLLRPRDWVSGGGELLVAGSLGFNLPGHITLGQV